MAKYSEIGTSVETLLDDLFKIIDKLNVKEGETFIIDFNKKYAYHSTRNSQNTFEIPWKVVLPIKSTSRNRKLIWTFFQLVEIDDKNSTKWSIKLIKNWFNNQEIKNNLWLKLLESRFGNSTKISYQNSLFLTYYMDYIIYQDEREQVFDLLKNGKDRKYYENLFKTWLLKNDKYLPIKKRKYLEEKICDFVENKLIKSKIKSRLATLRIVSTLKKRLGDWDSFPTNLFDSTMDTNIEKVKNLNSLIQHKEKIEVPSFQRGYVWKDTIVAKFISDLFDLIDGKIGEIFLGTLVFSKKGKNTLVLIDGQQRFITLLMVILAIGKYIGKENKKNCLPKCFVDYFKNISRKIDGNNHLLTLLSIFELKDTQDLSSNDLNSHIENIFHKIFSLVYKEENLAIIDKNIDNVWKIILEKIKIFTFVFSFKEKARKPLDIFVTMNTTSQIINSYDLMKAFLMSKICDNTDENLEKIDKYFGLNNHNNVVENLIYKKKLFEHYYYYLCIKFNCDLNEEKVEKGNVIDLSLKPYYYFVNNIFNLIKLEKNWESINNLYYFKDIEWFIKDFFAFSTFFYVLSKLLTKSNSWTRKVIKEVIPFKNFKEIIDLFDHLVKPISFYPILIFWFEKCASKVISIKELRSLMWSLVKYYLIKFQGEASSGWGQFFRTHHNEFKGKYIDSEKFLKTIKSILDEDDFHEGDCTNQIKTKSMLYKKYAKSIFLILEWYYRGISDLGDSKNIDIKTIFCDLNQNSWKRRELQENLWKYYCYELEHIAPNSLEKIKKSTKTKITQNQWDGVLMDIIALKESLGNKTLLLKKFNSSLKNKTYAEKKSYMKSQGDVLLINKNQTSNQFNINAFGMGIYSFGISDDHTIDLDEFPNVKDIKKREKNIVQQILLLLEWKF